MNGDIFLLVLTTVVIYLFICLIREFVIYACLYLSSRSVVKGTEEDGRKRRKFWREKRESDKHSVGGGGGEPPLRDATPPVVVFGYYPRGD